MLGEEGFAFRVCEGTASPGVADWEMEKNGVKQVNINVKENYMETLQK